MGLKQMYKGIANSPQTILTNTIGPNDTVIEVAGIDVFPAGPNVAVIGIDEEAETITYATKTDTALSGCKRGVEGKAKAWEIDSLISRNFTNYDYDTLIENILTLDKEKTASSDFTSFKDEIIKQLGNADTENGKKYATKQELSTAETNLDKKINTKLTTTTFEDYKNTNQTALDKKTNNTDFDIYKKEVTSNLAKKVDKVSGKGLSTNDYNNVEKAEVAKIKNLATSETVAGIKSEVETLKTSKVDKIVGKGLSTNDYTTAEKTEVAKIKNKADKTYVDTELSDKATATDLTKKIDKTSITSDLKGTDKSKVLSQEAGNELNKKFDTIGSSRSATIVIANYNSTEKSKKGADYVVKKGEDASKVIMTAEQEIKSTGGKILLLEGNYDCQSSIVLGYAESILEGCGAVLVQNTNWSETSYNGKTSKHFINNPSDFKSVIIKNLVLKGAKITGSNGIYCSDSSQVSNCTVSGSGDTGISCGGSSQVNNCTVSGSGDTGISCGGSSQVNNCTVSGSGDTGIVCIGSSQVNNCTVSGSGGTGIVCGGSSQVNNCTVSGSGGNGINCIGSSQVNNCTVSGSGGTGISCFGSFVGVCTFNTLKGDTLEDDSSTPAKVEYNVIQ